MRMRVRLIGTGLTIAVVLGSSLIASAWADLLSTLLPADVPGYDTQDGVTVRSRLHPDQQPDGVREGDFRFNPQLSQGLGYVTNALPGVSSRPSWEVITNPSLTLNSDWSRDAIGAALSLNNTSYLGLPSQDRTDATILAGGRLDLGRDQFTLAFAHLMQHEDRGEVGTLPTDRPIAFTGDDITAGYVTTAGRWRIEPGLRLTNWTYDSTTILGVPTSQAYRDRITLQGGVTLGYEWAPLRNILLVVRAIDQNYTHTQAGQASPDALAWQVLAGLDYDDNALWHWRLLAGGETQSFVSPLYARQNNLIAEAGLGWRPSGMTSVEATLTRESTAAEQEGNSGLMLTTAQLAIDHEYMRNLMLHASAGLQQADYFQGGHQAGFLAGLGITWVLNRSVRLSFTYDQTDLRGATSQPHALANAYSRGVGLMTLRLGL